MRGSWIDRALAILRRLIREDVFFEIETDPEISNIRVDPAQFEQLLMNLAINARDAMTEEGTLRIKASRLILESEKSFALATLPPGVYLAIELSDTGTGIHLFLQP